MTTPPVVDKARALGIEVAQPKALRAGPFPDRMEAALADVAVVVAYGRILPARLLAAPRHGCVNVHASLLPRWRGAAPIQRALLAGDQETGVCTQRMEEGLDTGPLYLTLRTPIGPSETAGALHDRLSLLAAEAAVRTLDRLTGTAPTPQSTEGVTWAPRLERDEARLSWSISAIELDRRVRGFHPWPGAFVETPKGPLKLDEVEPTSGAGPPGTVLATDPLTIACGAGAVALRAVRPAGRKAMTGAAYAMGARLAVGEPFPS